MLFDLQMDSITHVCVSVSVMLCVARTAAPEVFVVFKIIVLVKVVYTRFSYMQRSCAVRALSYRWRLWLCLLLLHLVGRLAWTAVLLVLREFSILVHVDQLLLFFRNESTAKRIPQVAAG